MKQWYEELFTNYANQYENESFTKGTLGEVDFIEKEIDFRRSSKILDIGCGTGRHTIELARRGYSLTGIDLSESMLAKARQKAQQGGLKVEFVQSDARALKFVNEFDLAIMMCEGGFSLMETDEMNYAILQSAAKALRENGKFIFTALCALFPLFHSIKDFLDAAKVEGTTACEGNSFDLMTFRDTSVTSVVDDSGNKKELHCSERFYVPSEITWLLKSLGFTTIDIYGAKLGAFSRGRKLTTDDFEMLVVAQK